MKYHRLTILLILIIAVISGSATTRIKPDKNPDYSFTIRFEQYGKAVAVVNNSVLLDPAQFDIIIEFPAPNGVLVNASFKDKTYKEAIQKVAFKSLTGFENVGMAEYPFNPDKEIALSQNSAGYWYFDSREKHRFNDVQETEGRIICRRTVTQLFDVPKNKNLKISEVSKPLYLVFISDKPGPEVSERLEVQRQYFTLNWKK